MFEALLRAMASALELPTHCALLGCAALSLWELGVLLGERLGGVATLEKELGFERLAALARRRIDRSELLTRLGPMTGLLGTLIPLGPGLAALGRGDVTQLARAVTVAFDTTVVGLAIGATGFFANRLRRRWYDAALDRLEHGQLGRAEAGPAAATQQTPAALQMRDRTEAARGTP